LVDSKDNGNYQMPGEFKMSQKKEGCNHEHDHNKVCNIPTVIDHNGYFFMFFNFLSTLCTIVSLYIYLFCAAFRVNPIEIV
jgi:hypothetical protein